MPHVGPLKDEEGTKCPFANQQSPTEEKKERATDKLGDYLSGGMVTLATSNKDEVKLLQELGFHLVDISQPVTTPSGSDKEVKVGELAGLSLTLIIPGVSEPLHVVVTGTELVHELRQFTVERIESCYRTCMSLYHNGAKLEEFVEVASVEGINNGSVIKFEEDKGVRSCPTKTYYALTNEPYSLRDARIHICRTKEILTDNIDVLCSGSEGMSFSFLPHITITNPEEDVKVRSRDAAAMPTKEAVQPPYHCLPTVNNLAPPLSAFYPHGYHTKPPDCLKELYYNKWNPPSSQRKLRGDLLYLTVQTLEGQEYGITSCYNGFYVNKCSGDQVFDPNPAKLAHHSHHLIGLLCQISPLFKKNFALLQKQGSKAHTLEVFPSPFKVYPWIVPQREHCVDNYFTLEGVFGTKIINEDQFIGQSQDWNEQFQSIKEMPTTTVAQKLVKEKAYYKVYMEYTSTAVKGAVAAVDGNIPPINCSEHVKQRMFIWNNIFLTFAFDSRDNYSDVGGDRAAWKAASHDLKNLSILNSFDIEGIHCSATVVVDYRGYRVIAQTIIPGILSHNHEDTVAYGTIDNGKTIGNNERLTDKLKLVAKEFFLKEETLLDHDGKEVSLVTSMDVKGIIGQDNRCYVVDLFRMLPPDANWFNWPDDCCFGKSEGTPQAEGGTINKTNDKDAMSASDTTGDTVPSAGDTVSGDTVTNVSDKAVGQKTTAATIAGNDTPSDITADTLRVDRATTDTPSDTTSDMSSNALRENQTSIEAEGDMVSEMLEQETSAYSSETKSSGVEPSDTITNTKGKSDTANNTTSDTSCDKRTDTNTHSEGNNTNMCSEDELSNKGACDMANEQRTDSSIDHMCINVKRSSDTVCYTRSDEMTDTEGGRNTGAEVYKCNDERVDHTNLPIDKAANVDGEAKMYMDDDDGDVLQDKRMYGEGDMPSDERADMEDDTSSDKRTGTQDDTPSDKRTDAKGDTPSDKRTDTKGDTLSDRGKEMEGDTTSTKADTKGDMLTGDRTEKVTHKEEAGINSKEESIGNFRTIIELYKKKMKENRSGQKLKFLRPELVKPFIHFKRLVYIQLLSASMEANKKRNKEEAKAADHVTEKVVTNGGDAVMTHPQTTANESADVEPHPSTNGDTATSEPHPSTLANKIDQSSATSDEEHNTVPNESHVDLISMVNGVSNESHSDLTPMINGVPNESRGDLTSMVNGLPNESHSDLTSMMNGRCSPLEEEKDRAKPTSTEQQSNHGATHTFSPLEAAAADIVLNKNDYFDIRFNADLFTPGARHSKSEAELHKDFTILDDMGQFLLESVIPKLVNDCLQLVVVPSDGEALTNLMHSRGINMRYLGLVAELSTCRRDLDHLYQLCITEMINRAARKLLANELHQASLYNVATVIVYFLNCYLGLPAESSSEAIQEEPRKKSKKKRKPFSRTESLLLVLTKESLWSSLVQMIYNNFCYELNYDSMEELCGTLHINKIVLLRRLCKTVGIQLIVREYDFTAQPTFSEGDIFNVLPIVKTAMIKPTDGGALFELASSQVNAGNLGNAQELATQSLGVYSQVFGPLHSDVANCYRLMARMHFMGGESVPAMCFQHKAAMIFERVLGVDHPDTVAAYVNLALYCHHCEQTTVALRLMYRVRYLILLMFGPDTPEIATCDCNIALMLHSCKEYERSLTYLEYNLHLNIKYHGEESLQVALNHHLIARALTFTGDFRSALNHEKITYNIHKEKLGEEHQRTKESAECLEQLTEKAVKMQKQINEITSSFPSSSRAATRADLPGQWGDVAVMCNSTKKPSKSSRTKKKSRSKLNGEHVKETTQ